MSIIIAGYSFEGPYQSMGHLKDKSGVYAILSPSSNNNYDILDVGESAKVKERVDNHDRENCWKRNANSRSVRYAAYYTGASARMKIENVIRNRYNMPCGKK